jgi:hypothetical protein
VNEPSVSVPSISVRSTLRPDWDWQAPVGVGRAVGVGSYLLPSRVPMHLSRSLACSANTTSNSTVTDWNADGIAPGRTVYSTVRSAGSGVGVGVAVSSPDPPAVPVGDAAPPSPAVGAPVVAAGPSVPADVALAGVSTETPGNAPHPASRQRRQSGRT